jgi:hypothetical protein
VVRDFSFSVDDWPSLSEPGRLYHYTDPGGLLGIVKNRVLWASDVWFMNDTREGYYGNEVLRRVLDDFNPSSPVETEIHTRAMGLLNALESQDDVVRSYIACLSLAGDQLSQWRAYGWPRGFSLGFDSQQLRQVFPALPGIGTVTWRKVGYEPGVHESMFLGFLHDAITDAGRRPEGEAAAPYADQFILRAVLLAPAFKASAFAEEKEVRLQIFTTSSADSKPELNFRAGAYGLTPYVEVPLAEAGATIIPSLREVIVGPQPNQAEAARATRQLLARHEYTDVDVRLSNVPLRS